ncbi:MAG: T9SS type A sorting domain-containing protein [Prevotellaceae bacterium]|jgi:hypothetical protein|nr:T9SS type A sorting domain-containing protein [Prevotellaceae bacterium]
MKENFNILSLLIALFIANATVAQTDMTVVKFDGNEMQISISQNGILSFDVENLLIKENSKVSELIVIPRAEIRKLTFSEYTGIEDALKNTFAEQKIKIYPNPATDELQIMNYELQNGEKVEIYDIAGKLRKFIVISNSSFVVVSDLSAGVYLLKINNQILKFIKK